MGATLIVPSVPWMPERAWTTCVSNGCISGLARANYVPFAPQPFPPGVSADDYTALDPAPTPGFGVPPPYDCFPRYVMWREDARVPDFLGGPDPVSWLRQPGWDYRQDCVPICNQPYYDTDPASLTPGDCDVLGDTILNANVAGLLNGSGNYVFDWRLWDDDTGTTEGAPSIWLFTENPVIPHADMRAAFPGNACTGHWQLVLSDAGQPSCAPVVTAGNFQWCCE